MFVITIIIRTDRFLLSIITSIIISSDQPEVLPVAMHKDSLEDGVHHVLYFILVFLKLCEKVKNASYRQATF